MAQPRDIGKFPEVSLYIVRSPLQLFNCHEASRHYGDDGYKIVLILYRKEFDRDLMLKVLDRSAWDEVIVTDFRSNLVQFRLIGQLLAKIPAIGYCFLGDYTHSINMLINRRTPRHIVWLDDGVVTLHRAKLMADEKFFKLDKHFHKKSKLIVLLEKMLQSDRDYLKRAEFFTIYESIRDYSSTLRVRTNDYRFFRRRCAELPVRDVAFFIGTDLRREVLKNPDDFERYLDAIGRHYRGKPWCYVLHRKEDLAYMKGLGEKYNFTVERFDRILEQQFLHQGWCPSEVSTTCSSALDTVGVIYRPRLAAFVLREEDVRQDQLIGIQELYGHYQRMNVEMLRV